MSKFDIIIKNGTIYDGSGMNSYVSDIFINDSKIVKIDKSKAEKFSYKKPDEAFKLNEKFKKPIPLKKATNIFNKNYEKQKSKMAKK